MTKKVQLKHMCNVFRVRQNPRSCQNAGAHDLGALFYSYVLSSKCMTILWLDSSDSVLTHIGKLQCMVTMVHRRLHCGHSYQFGECDRRPVRQYGSALAAVAGSSCQLPFYASMG